jgi:carboxymethylenebutenolidase
MRADLPSGTSVHVARPAVDPSTRGLVIAPDIMGLRPLFEAMADRLAAEHGWAVAAVEPFPGQEELDLEGRMKAAAGLDDAAVLTDLVAAADLLGTDRTAVLGFCMGGMYAFKAAGTGRFDRAVAFYGMISLPGGWRGPGQGEPLEHLQRPGASPVLAILGGHDPYTPPGDIERLREVDGVEVALYPDADHGFVHDPSRPNHRPDDAADAWRRVIDFLG